MKIQTELEVKRLCLIAIMRNNVGNKFNLEFVPIYGWHILLVAIKATNVFL